MTARFLPQCLRQMRFAHAGRTAEKHIAFLSQVVSGSQCQKLLAVNAGIEGEGERLQGFGGVESAAPQTQRELLLSTAFDLVFQEA